MLFPLSAAGGCETVHPRIMATLRLTHCGNASGGSPDTQTATIAQREFQGVVFDMDGLLLDTERLYRIVFQELVREHGHTLSDAGYARMVGHRVDTSKQVLAEELGPTAPVDAIFDQLNARYHARIAKAPVPLRPGALELIRKLQQLGIPLALATSTYRDLTDAKLRNVGLETAFCVTICGDEVEHGKPHPEPYLRAVQGLGIAPAQAIALEDSPTGLTAAHTAGLYTILVPDLITPDANSLAMADATAGSLHEVCQRIR